MTKPAKTNREITWSDGKTAPLRRDGGGWAWWTPRGHGAWSSHLSNAIASIEDDGGTVRTVPNPHYEAEATAHARREIRRLLGFDL